METRKDAEKIQHLQALYQWEQKLEEEKLTEQKRNLMQAHLVGSEQKVFFFFLSSCLKLYIT